MAETDAKISGWGRSLIAAERVEERLRRATRALDTAGVAYAVIGGNAVAEWVARVDEDAVRNTKDVDLLVRRNDLLSVRTTLESAGFVSHRILDKEVFIDGPEGRPTSGIHIHFAGEQFRPGDEYSLPDLDDSERAVEFRVVKLEALVRMKLIAWRSLDRTHLYDMIGVRLLDATWPTRFPAPLGDRLQQLLDDPNG